MDLDKITPVAGIVLVEEDSAMSVTKSGIHLTKGTKPNKGKVIAIGGEYDGHKPPCKAGDVVIFKRWEGSELQGVKHSHVLLLFKFEHIMAFYRE